MSIVINGLEIPPTLSYTAELFGADAQRRTVGMRLITKLAPVQKWRLTIQYNGAVCFDFQQAFYNMCRFMRSSSAQVNFISPYDGQNVSTTMTLVSMSAPAPVRLHQSRPDLYIGCGAVFEEV